MSFHRSLGNAQLARDLLGCEAALHQHHDLCLARRKQYGGCGVWTSSHSIRFANSQRRHLSSTGPQTAEHSITNSDYTGFERNMATSY
jgi:hypothetical protein